MDDEYESIYDEELDDEDEDFEDEEDYDEEDKDEEDADPDEWDRTLRPYAGLKVLIIERNCGTYFPQFHALFNEI